jgi:hypothetical protein
MVNSTNVDSEFFPLMGIRFLAGRNFISTDRSASTVIVSRTTAERMYGTVQVVGAGFPKSEPTRTIVGVVADARLFQIATTGIGQQYSPLAPGGLPGAVLLVKARRQPGAVLPVARAVAKDADARVLARTWLMRDALDEKLRPIRLSGVIASALSGLTLLLACVGVAALISNWVVGRTREIGIRVALGASPTSVVRKVLAGISWPVGIGAAIGAASAAIVGFMLKGHPFYVDPSDWRAPVGGLAVLVVAMAVAALVPAKRALSIQPTQALRHD